MLSKTIEKQPFTAFVLSKNSFSTIFPVLHGLMK